MADWSEILPEILIEITTNLNSYEDFLAFSLVCSSWRSVATEVFESADALPSRYPCLILPDDDEDNDKSRRQFYLLSNGGMIRDIKLPESSKRRCLSARGGWLLTIAKDGKETKLLHSHSRVEFSLPNLDTFPADYNPDLRHPQHLIRKVVLSSSPNPKFDFDEEEDSLLVMVLWGSDMLKIGFCKVGDDSWTVTEEWADSVHDIAYHKGLVYGVTELFQVLVCNPHGPPPFNLKLLATMPRSFMCNNITQEYSRVYLLHRQERGGAKDPKFLIVIRGPEYHLVKDRDGIYYLYHVNNGFVVVECDLNDGGKWSKVESLGNKAVFVGYNTSFSVEASYDGCVKPNCIYYTDDSMEVYLLYSRKGGGSDVGVYDLSLSRKNRARARARRYSSYVYEEKLCSFVTPPTWIF